MSLEKKCEHMILSTVITKKILDLKYPIGSFLYGTCEDCKDIRLVTDMYVKQSKFKYIHKKYKSMLDGEEQQRLNHLGRPGLI